MERKGFVITGVLYVLLIIFLASLTMLLFNLQNRKMILDQLKLDGVEAVESDNNYEYLLNRISDLESKLNSKTILSKKEKISKTVSVPSDSSYTVLDSYIASKEGLYIFNGRITFSPGKLGIRSAMITISDIGTTTRDVRMVSDVSLSVAIPISEVHYLEEGQTIEFKANQESNSPIITSIDYIVEYSNE